MAHERLFDYPFDFQKYIEQRLREFDDIDERKYAKSVIQDGLLNIIKETEKRYEALEKRIRDEIEIDDGKYVVRTTVIPKQEYDPTNVTWFPVLEEDLTSSMPTAADLYQENSESLVLGYVYIEADDIVCNDIIKKNPVLQGKIIFNSEEIAANFTLKQSERHREKVAYLYTLFHINSIPWSTFPAEHVDKFYEIHLSDIKKKPDQSMHVLGVEVDYAEYTQIAHSDWMLLWNIEKIQYNCAQFPIPCIDSVNYEHEFPAEDFGVENGFLIESNEEIANLRYQENKILIMTPRSTFTKWDAWKIVTKEAVSSLGYTKPILSNEKRMSFSGGFLKHTGQNLKTKTDLIRKINELNMDLYINFDHCEICETKEEGMLEGDMNWFIKDELFDKNTSRILLLKFKAVNKENYLNSAIVRYVVSEIQQSQSEYHCMGILIE